MKPVTLLILVALLLPAPAAAQAPLVAQARAAAVALERERATDDQWVVLESKMEHPILFWAGAGLLAVGVIAMLGSVTWARDSDLSNEFQSVRLGTDLAPCGTDLESTRLPVAECKINDELFWLGAALTITGGGLMVVGGKQIETVQRRPMVHASIRF